MAGLSILAFLGSWELLDRRILETSAGRKSKAFQDLIETVSVFLIIGSTGISRIVPGWLAVITLGLLGSVKVYRLKMHKRFRKNFSLDIGESYWIGLAALIFLGSYLNEYFIFYGLVVLCLVLIYDLFSLIKKIER
ncbi:MAG: hypothetical protein BRC29_04015 [Nanohaloarchaea archaeon SW_7_43_1]|nr:MAG: hypothetical protein BRC29_04015 [Nanohaloarchaea archaeon SW_7_43_1]